jgi:hypothetical protein
MAMPPVGIGATIIRGMCAGSEGGSAITAEGIAAAAADGTTHVRARTQVFRIPQRIYASRSIPREALSRKGTGRSVIRRTAFAPR